MEEDSPVPSAQITRISSRKGRKGAKDAEGEGKILFT